MSRGDLGDAGADGDEAVGGETGEAGEVLLAGVEIFFELEALEFELRAGAAGASELDGGVLAGVETVLHDLGEACGVALLGGHDGEAFDVVVERDVGDDGVLGDLLAGFDEGEIGGVEAGVGGAEIVLLRVVEGQRLRGDVEDGGRRDGHSIGVTEARAADDAGDVGVVGLGEDGAGLVDVGHGHADARAVLEGEVDGGGEGYLGVSRDGGEADDREETKREHHEGWMRADVFVFLVETQSSEME